MTRKVQKKERGLDMAEKFSTVVPEYQTGEIGFVALLTLRSDKSTEYWLEGNADPLEIIGMLEDAKLAVRDELGPSGTCSEPAIPQDDERY